MNTYRNLADAVEDLKEKGYTNLSGELETDIDRLPEKIEKMSIIQTLHFDSGTDPADEATLYVLELEDKSRCFLVVGYGTYKDPEKSKVIETLKKLEKKRQPES